MGQIAFISGHGNLTFEEFIKHYKPQIDKALESNHFFILGDFNGCDTLTQEYLKNKTDKVAIYHCFNKPRYKVNRFELKSTNWNYYGGYTNDNDRDKAMTKCSDYDIAWVRIGKEKNGTAKNIKRRESVKI